MYIGYVEVQHQTSCTVDPVCFFSKDDSVWSSSYRGYNGLNNLHTAISRHEKTVSHLSAFIVAKTFGQIRIDTLLNQQRYAAINQHNEEVKKMEKS